MLNFVFVVTEPSSYGERNRSSMKVNFLVSVAIFILVTVVSDWKYGLVLGFVFWVVQYFKSYRWDKSFITSIEHKDGQVMIKYKNENQQKEISGNIEDFKIKKETAFNRTRTVYLAIYFKNAPLLKQFEIGDWNEKVFDKIISEIS